MQIEIALSWHYAIISNATLKNLSLFYAAFISKTVNAIGIKRLLSSRFFIHTLKIFNVNTFFLEEEKIDEYFSILAVFHLD